MHAKYIFLNHVLSHMFLTENPVGHGERAIKKEMLYTGPPKLAQIKTSENQEETVTKHQLLNKVLL